MSRLMLEARPRSVTGKKVKKLRHQGLLPANVYGHNVPSQALEIDAHAFTLLQRHLSASSIIDLKVDGAVKPVMIHRIQRDYRSGHSNHVELFAVNMLERLTASVPLVVVGTPESVRRNEGVVLLQDLDTLEVYCLPGDLPTSIEVSVENLLEPGDAVYVRDLKIDRSTIEVRTHEDERVAGLAAAQIRPEEEAEQPAVTEEATAEGEGEAPSEA
jgi:large subunit ribosomal protein L25